MNTSTSENCILEFTLNPAAPPFVPGSKYVSDLNSVVSKVTLVPTTRNPNKQLDDSS